MMGSLYFETTMRRESPITALLIALSWVLAAAAAGILLMMLCCRP
jgi:hypothetical protein